MRALLLAAVTLLLLLVALRLLLPRIVPQFVFYPEPLRPQESDPQYWGFPEATELKIRTADDLELHAWWFPAQAPDVRCGTAIYFHGNAGHLGDRGAIASGLSRLGLDVLLLDYRGYGLSQGKPSEEGLYRDAEAAYRHVTEERSVPADRVVVIGNSLGAAVAAQLCTRFPVAGLVLLGAFTNTPSVARRAVPWMPDWLLAWQGTRFDTSEHVRDVDAPLFVAAGSEDAVIAPEEGRAVYEAAREPKTWYEATGAGHNDIFSHTGLWQQLYEFTRTVLSCADGEKQGAAPRGRGPGDSE